VGIAPLSVLVPVLVACTFAALSPFVRRRQGLLGIAGALATLGLTIAMVAGLGGHLVVWFGGWEPRRGVAVGVDFAVDGIGGGMALLVAVLGVLATVVSSRVIRSESAVFDALTLVFVAAMIGFCLTGDLFNLFVFFELMSVATYALVGYEVRRRAALEGSLTFAIANSVGSMLLLFGIALLYGRTGALNLAQIGNTLAAAPSDRLVVVSFALLGAGFLAKAAVVPFHLWTADAYAVAPTPICLLLAGAFSELGLYAFARVYWTVYSGVLAPHADALRAILIGAGLLTGLLGAAMCALQHHLKRMLAFATIAQVGLFLVAIGLLSADGLAGAATWIVADALVKAALFACVAVIQHRYDTLELADLHGRARELWPLGVLFALGGLMIASLPPSGSFLAKSVVEDAALAGGYPWVPPLLVLVTGVVGGVVLRAAARVFLGLGEPAPRDPAGEEEGMRDEREADPPRRSPVLLACAAVLLAGSMAWGIAPGLLDTVGRAAAAFTDRAGYAAAVLHGRAVHAAAPSTLHGPGVTGLLYAVASVVLAVGFAAVTLRGSAEMPAPLARALNAVRRLHSGRPGDYVAWMAVGAAALAGLFAAALQ
jgi:multicomponent Na+:H+ antiporter subunit D